MSIKYVGICFLKTHFVREYIDCDSQTNLLFITNLIFRGLKANLTRLIKNLIFVFV